MLLICHGYIRTSFDESAVLWEAKNKIYRFENLVMTAFLDSGIDQHTLFSDEITEGIFGSNLVSFQQVVLKRNVFKHFYFFNKLEALTAILDTILIRGTYKMSKE